MSNTVSENENTRRDFLKRAGAALAAVTLAGCAPQAVEPVIETVEVEVEKPVPQEIPANPWPYQTLDVELVRKKGHEGYSKMNCCYGGAYGVLSALKETVGFPYTQIPVEMFAFGGGGVAGWGTTCGALIGAAAAISLVAKTEDVSKLVNELMTWYSSTALPTDEANATASKGEYMAAMKVEGELPQSVSNSPLCHASVSNWCVTAGKASGSPDRLERCARLTGDVSAKAVELLNAYAAGQFAPALKLPEDTQMCMACHTVGENFEAGHFTAGKMECTECHEPHDIK